MKTNPFRTKLALLVAISLVALGIVAYAATVVIVAVGNTPHSELLGGPATVICVRGLIHPVISRVEKININRNVRAD